MKKLISIIAAAALIFTMSLPVVAASSPSVESPSVNPSGDASGDSSGDSSRDSSGSSTASGSTASGSTVNVTETAASLSPAEENSIQGAAASVAGNNAFILHFTNIEAPAGYFRNHDTLRVEFIRDFAPNLLGVLYWNSQTQSWDMADFSVNGNVISAVFLHTCTVAFVVKAPAITQSLVSHAESTDAVSPQTGMSYTVWGVCTLATAAGSCVCIMLITKLRKKEE